MDELIRAASGRVRTSARQGKIVMLTSGTTGVPKGAARKLKYRALAGPLTTLLTKTPMHARTTVLITSPLFHGFGLAYLALSLLLGATIVIRRRFTAEEVLADIARQRVQILVAVPTTFKRLLEVLESIRSGLDCSSLQAMLSSGAPLDGELRNRLAKAFVP